MTTRNRELHVCPNPGERGATMVEYAFMLALIALVCVVAVQALGHAVSAFFDSVVAYL